MISLAHYNLSEPLSSGYSCACGYALIVFIAALLFLALLTNPVLP